MSLCLSGTEVFECPVVGVIIGLPDIPGPFDIICQERSQQSGKQNIEQELFNNVFLQSLLRHQSPVKDDIACGLIRREKSDLYRVAVLAAS